MAICRFRTTLLYNYAHFFAFRENRFQAVVSNRFKICLDKFQGISVPLALIRFLYGKNMGFEEENNPKFFEGIEKICFGEIYCLLVKDRWFKTVEYHLGIHDIYKGSWSVRCVHITPWP